ncbi:tetraspanin-15-like isoform X2 [Amphiura filiformis]|uniref:tetraspanin-15-like isoform X2 n=1 Tax=Amphiura filiformis TaxID=82378 RepID=UPI003B213A17
MGLPRPSCGHRCLRFLLFFYMFVFWAIGSTLLGLGIYAEIEKRSYEAVTDVFVSPSSLMIAVGAFMFILGFIGCIGTLRENIILLQIFAWTLAVVFALQLITAIVAFVFRNKASALVSDGIRGAIEDYYNDPDIHFAIDTLQQEFECCGGYDFNDWDNNIYFTCGQRGPTACAVPYSCCISTKVDMVPNTQCGYKVRENSPTRFDVDNMIFVRGCTDAMKLWAEDNLKTMAVVVLVLAIPQIAGIFMTFLFILQVEDEQIALKYET